MRKTLLILFALISLSVNAQIVNKFRDSTWFAKGVQFDSTLNFKGLKTGGVADTFVVVAKSTGTVSKIPKSTFLSGVSSGGVTSVATNTGSGITGGTITSTGTLVIDTTIVSTKNYVNAKFAQTTNGTVTSVATGIGLSGGTITTSGTLVVDTNVISTKANVTGLLLSKQDNLISGTNIKTINSNSLLGSGNIVTPDAQTLTAGTNTLTISGGNTVNLNRKVDTSYIFRNATLDSTCMITVINGITYRSCAKDSVGSGTAYTFSTGLTNTSSTITNNLSTGVSGGQSVIGGTASGENLTLSSTSNATKGKILFGTSAYDEVNNRLGIGTTSPGARLDVSSPSGGAGTGIRLIQAANNLVQPFSYTSIDFTVPTTGLIGQFFATASNYSNPSVNLAANSIGLTSWDTNGQLFLAAGGSNGYISFDTGGYGYSNERMRILANGNVGIGSTTPSQKLSVNGNAAVGLDTTYLPDGITKAGGALLVGSTSLISSLGYGTLRDNVIQLGDNVSTSGYTHSPSMAFSTNQTSANQLLGRFLGLNSSLGTAEKRLGQISFYTDTATNNGKIDFSVNNGTSFITSLTIKSSGNVGIGAVTSPTARLNLPAGTASAGTAPLKLTAGTNLTTPENGAFEFDGTNLYFTVGGVRKTVTLV